MIRALRRAAAAAALLLSIPGITGCAAAQREPQVLGDLARETCTVLLPEGEDMVPYLVLTEDYAGTGCALLLRKYVLDQPQSYNPNENYGAYYENSAADRLLSETFRASLGVSPETVPVEITAYDSLHGQGQDVKSVQRQVFLLSALEAGCGSGRTFLAEGEAMACMEEEEYRIARTESGEAVTWWLRTPCAWYDNVVCGINADGVLVFCGLGGITQEAENRLYIRPALCLRSDTEICPSGSGDYELKEDLTE